MYPPICLAANRCRVLPDWRGKKAVPRHNRKRANRCGEYPIFIDIKLVVLLTCDQNLKGRLLVFVRRTIGRRVLESPFGKSVKAIESRNGGGTAGAHSNK